MPVTMNGSPGAIDGWSAVCASTAAGESGSAFAARCHAATASAFRPVQ